MTTKEKSNSALTIHEWVNIHHIASSQFRTCSLHGIREALRPAGPQLATEKAADGGYGDEPQLAMAHDGSVEKGNKFPSYRELFKETEAAGPVDHDSSLISPAAYFVDLMRLIEAKITKGEQNDWKGLEDLKLEKRRPDLWDIELDAKNTTTEVPYLAIVNEVMAKKLNADSGKDALQQLATATYPFNLPYNAPLEQIRTCLAHFGVKLTNIYETFILPEENDAGVTEALGLCPGDLTHLRSSYKENWSDEELAKAYGLPGRLRGPDFGGLKKVETFLKQTGLTPDEFAELCHAYPLSLVPNEEAADSVEPQAIEGLDLSILSELYFFIRLRKRMNWSFGDLISAWNWAWLNDLAQVKKLSEKYELPVDVLCSIVHHMNTKPGFAAPNKPTPKSLFDRVFNTPPFYQGDGSTEAGYHPGEPETAPLRWDSLPLPKWAVGLPSTMQNWISHLELAGKDDKDFSSVQELVKEKDIQGAGTRLKKMLIDSGVDDSEDPSKFFNQQCIRSSLLAALEVGNDELQVIIDHLCNKNLFDKKVRLNAKKIPLDVPTLTRLYRFSKMANVLGMQVQEYLVLLRCITVDEADEHLLTSPEISNLDDLDAVDYWADWLKEAGLSPYQLEYLTTGTVSDEAQRPFDPGWTNEGLAQLSAALYATLEPRLINPQSFAHGMVTSKKAAGVVTAFHEAGLIVDVTAIQVNEGSSELRGLVRCQLSGASLAPGKLPRVSRRQVIDAIAHPASPDAARDASRDLVRLKARFPDQQPRTEFPGAGFKEVTKALDVITKKEWDINVGGKLRNLAKDVADHNLAALIDAKAFCSEAELNQQQFEELCWLAIGDQRKEGYFSPDQSALRPFIRLAKTLDWSLTDLHWALKSIEGDYIDRDRQQLLQLWLIKLLQAKLNIPLDVMCAFWKTLWTSGGRAVIDIPSPSEHTHDPVTKHSSEAFERASKFAAIRDELLHKADAVYAITDTLNRELEFQMQSTIQQLAAGFNLDWHLVASVVDYLNFQERGTAKFLTGGGLRDAALLLYLAKALGLTTDGFDAVLKSPNLFGFSSSRSKIQVSLDTTRSVHAFAELVETFEKHGSLKEQTARRLIAYLRQQTDSHALIKLSGWKKGQVEALQEHLGEMSKMAGVFGLATMKQCFDLAAKLGVDVQMLIQLCRLHKDQTGFDDYSAAAHSLLRVVKSKYADDEWEKTFGPIRDHLNERERDALVGLLMIQLSQDKHAKGKAIATHFDGMNSLQDLSDYLLIDVEMSGVAKVSKLKQGLNTLQRYIQRCHMGLEENATFSIGDNEWSWRSHYRLWEANRKVFLYPENYLDPGLRKQKTPLYKAFEDELLQGEITDEVVTKAFINYFDKLDELASLKMVCIDAASVANPKSGENAETLFLIGKSKNDPSSYYCRSALIDPEGVKIIQWRPWQKINLSIHAEHTDDVACKYDNHRLYLYWIEKKTVPAPRSAKKADDERTEATTTEMVKYSYQNVGGSWVIPQTLLTVDDKVNDLFKNRENKIRITRSWRKLKKKRFLKKKTLKETRAGRFTVLCSDPFIKYLVDDQTSSQGVKGHEWINDKFDGNPRQVSALVASADGTTLIAETEVGYYTCQYREGDWQDAWQELEKYPPYGFGFNKPGGMEISEDGLTLLVSNSDGLCYARSPNFNIKLDALRDKDASVLLLSPDYSFQEAFFFDEITVPLGTTALDALLKRLVTGGIKAFMSTESQRTISADLYLYNPYAIYFREIFFYIPFLIADTLNSNLCFEDAQKWYHYIFNPIVQNTGDITSEINFWQYRLFQTHTLSTLNQILANKAELAIYENDPFDPIAIAGLRLGAYEKAIVMKYIDNLLDWGDQLFAQDSWESIVQAMMLYGMAQDLLGKKPKQTRLPHSPVKVLNFDEFDESTVDFADPFHVEDVKYFPVAPNTNFTGYWDRVEDRLFKIRHCMNIKGVLRQLALFQPPIDPRQLIRALAAGGDLASVTSRLAAPVPHYRFTAMIQQAKSVTSTLFQLGSALLSALEKKDAEQMNLLRSTHEKAILNLTTRIKEKQVEDVGKNLDALNASLDSATDRRNHYHHLIESKLSTEETASLNQMIAALSFQTASTPLHAISVPAYLTPSIYGLADGGSKFGNAVQVAAQVSDSTAMVMNQGSQLAGTKAQNERRKEEWELQEALAGHDVEQINAQIEGAKIRQEVAQKDLDLHHISIEQAGEREDFFRTKFANHDLYQWMVGQISSVYFQTYKIAFDLAKAAEKAYQYERNSDDTLITFGYWDSLKKGLLAGEGLMLGLNQLEKAYKDDNERTLEIEKTISLRQIEPRALLDLRIKGKCNFDLKESLFDRDFPGHYCRKIASIAISIPAIVGPYQNVQASLIQQTSRVVLTNDIEPVEYLTTTGKTKPTAQQLRFDPRAKQQIALSRGVNDSGLFELNFHDERYLPFEGTGAVSSWELHMHKAANRIDFNSISDVIIHLRYTALDGGANLRDLVVKLGPIIKDAGERLISLRQEYAAEWQAAKDGTDFKISIEKTMFPMNLTSLTIGDITMWTVAKGKVEIAPAKPPAEPVKPHSKWSIKVPKDKLDSVDDIYLLVPFTGDLDWATPS